MKTVPLALAAALLATAAVAQTAATPPRPVTPGSNIFAPSTAAPSTTVVPGVVIVHPTPPARGINLRETTSNAPAPGVNPSTGTSLVDRNSDAAAASGDRNQAVATTDANAPQPARGADSFSRGEVQNRIAGHGFQNVSDLHKDGNGIWRGTATKDGQQVHVWLDYRGDIGQQ